jgi:hypothetical protein
MLLFQLEKAVPDILSAVLHPFSIHVIICVSAGASKRFKQLLLQQTGEWDEEAAALLANFQGRSLLEHRNNAWDSPTTVGNCNVLCTSCGSCFRHPWVGSGWDG